MKLFNENKGNDLDYLASISKSSRTLWAGSIFGITEKAADEALTDGPKTKKQESFLLAVQQVLFIVEWMKVAWNVDIGPKLVGFLHEPAYVIYDKPVIEVSLLSLLGDKARLLTTADIDATWTGIHAAPAPDEIKVGDLLECVTAEETIMLRYDVTYEVRGVRQGNWYGAIITEVCVAEAGDRSIVGVWYPRARFRKLDLTPQPPLFPELDRG